MSDNDPSARDIGCVSVTVAVIVAGTATVTSRCRGHSDYWGHCRGIVADTRPRSWMLATVVDTVAIAVTAVDNDAVTVADIVMDT